MAAQSARPWSLWTEWPQFGWELRERWNCEWPTFSFLLFPVGSIHGLRNTLFAVLPHQWDHADGRKEAQAILSLVSFTARLYAAIAKPAAWYYFDWTMRDALETPTPEGWKKAVEVAMAAQWIVHSGEKLKGKLRPEWPVVPYDRLTIGGPLFEDECGLTPERWAFWKQRFGEFSESLDGAEAETKQLCRRAVELM